MFGLVTASVKELRPEQRRRYNSIYCGICRAIREQHSQLCRLGLSYDMAFLALLLMSMYEPEEQEGSGACLLHPIKKKPWVDNECIRYAADMNVALAYYKALDDWSDDRKPSAKLAQGIFGKNLADIEARWPEQCAAIARCIEALRQLEQENCPNPDEGANTFGQLMGALFAWKQDRWTPLLRLLGHYLGRYIYLADAAIDYDGDVKKGKYNPFHAMGGEADLCRWEEHLVQAMAGCTDTYEKLPLVQDKGILDNILYSGVWLNYRRAQKKNGKER